MPSQRHIGPYTVDALLGSGASGEVWSTDDPFAMAVKIVRRPESAPMASDGSLSLEVRAIARLHHPGVVTIYDHGEADGRTYLAMERADATLAERMPDRWTDVVDVVRQLLDALAHAHAHGIVHRDLKPSNVLAFARPSGGTRFALSDFGIAFLHDDDESLGIRGTPTSMAPEQFEGRWYDYGPPTDLYALGCLVWRIVAGSPPWRGDPRSLAVAHRAAPLPPLEPRMPVPPGIEPWLRVLLRKEPEARFARAADARHAFDALGPPGASRPAWAPPPRREPTRTLEVGEVAPASRGEADLESRALRRPFADVDEALGAPAVVPLPARALAASLVAARELPTVGRLEERRTLWATLREVATDARPAWIVLRGPRGSGRHHLASWLAHRADELGAARGVITGGPPEDLVLAVLGARDLRGDALASKIRVELRRRGVSEGDQGVLERSLGLREGWRPQRAELAASLRALVGAAVHREPHVIVLDEPSAELREALEGLDHGAALFVTIGRAPGRARALEIAPLLPGARIQALATLLPMTHGLAARLVADDTDLSEARRQLTAWADAGRLVPTEEGYRLVDGPPPEPMPEADRGGITAVAALIGVEVDWRLWMEACASHPPSEVLRAGDRLVASGDARADGTGLRFVDASARARWLPSRKARELHLAIARALRRLPPTPGHLERLGRHLVAGGDVARGDEVLLRAAGAAHQAGRYHDALRALGDVSEGPERHWRSALALTMLGDLDRAEAAARQALEGEGRHRVASLRALGAIDVRRGRRESATSWLERAVAVPGVDQTEQHLLARADLASCLLALDRPAEARARVAVDTPVSLDAGLQLDVLRGRFALEDGDASAALEAAERACRTASRVGSRIWEGIALVDAAMALRRLGRLDEARERCRRAVERFDSIAAFSAAASARLSLAGVEADAGRHQAAIHGLEPLVPRLTEARHAAILLGVRVAMLRPLLGLGAWDRFDEVLRGCAPLDSPGAARSARTELQRVVEQLGALGDEPRRAAVQALHDALGRATT